VLSRSPSRGCIVPLLTLLLVSSNPLSAQEKLLPVYQFRHVDGLTSDQIRSRVVRDRQGFVWIGTINGLDRYDGTSVKSYRHDPKNPHSLSSNPIKALFVDSKGRLWAGTHDAGINLYDPAHDWFIPLPPRQGDSSWYQANSIADISEDRSGNIWLASVFGGVVRVTLPEGHGIGMDSFSRGLHFTTYNVGTRGNYSCCVIDQKDGTYLLGSDSGVVILNSETHAISRFHLSDPVGCRLDSLVVNCMLEDSRGECWVGTSTEGLFRIDRTRKRVSNYRHREGDPLSIKSDDILDIAENKDGNLWIGSNLGIDLISPQSNNCIPFLFAGSASVFPTSYLRMFVDQDGTFWVGIMNGGEHFLSPRSFRFPSYSLPRKDGVSAISFVAINRVAEAKCWCMSGQGILYKIDFATGDVEERIDVLRGEKSAYEDYRSLVDAHGIYWFGTWGLGLFRVDLEKRTVKNYPLSLYLSDDIDVSDMAKGEGDTLLLARVGDGLTKFAPASGKETSVPGLPLLMVSFVMRAHDGTLWLSSQNQGITVLDPATGRVERQQNIPTDSTSLSSNFGGNMRQDSSGQIWVASGNMLNRWNVGTHSFTRYGNEEFSLASIVHIIGSDYRGRVWLHYSGSGNSIFNPSNGLFTNYDWSDGVSTASQMENLPDGRVVLPSWSGIIVVHPDSLAINRPPPPLVITRMSINDEPSVPPRVSETTQALRLPYSQNVLEFEFSAIDIDAPHTIEYQYRLDGLEREWVKPKDRHYVRYPGLSPGNYAFKVKATSLRGDWPPQEIFLAISIAPPWYRSSWAYTLYGLLAAGTLFAAYRLRLRQVQLKQQAAMEHFQAEHLAEVDRLKSRFYSNVSHEFRTPLTLILGPADQLLEETDKLSSQEKLHLIKANARKLFGLVNQLLDFSRLEAGMVRLQVSSGDIVQFLRRVVMSFESWAERKRINLEFHSEPDTLEGYIDQDKVEKIVNNLMSNALKFTEEGGAVSVSLRGPKGRSNLSLQSQIASSLRNAPRNDLDRDEFIELSVADTGPGIPPEHLPHIFDRFYRVDETHTSEGTGIGLALTKELVELHHGTITVESILGKGSKFTVVLPVGESAYQAPEIVEAPISIEKPEHTEIGPSPEPPAHIVSKPPVDGKPIVFVVEDNADLRAYISGHLNVEYSVHEAANGKEGYERAAEIVPDLVISDVMMPEMDGMELCRALKQDLRTSHVPVILLTARADLDSKLGGLEIGADDYVTKPFESKELLARVRNLIGQRQQLRKKFSAGVVLKPGEVAVTSLDDALLKKVMEAVEKNIGNESFGVDDLAREAFLSRRHLYRKLQALTNLAPAEFIQYIRLQRGYELLEKNAGSIAEVAYQVGFGSPSHFSSCFHERFGFTPSEILNRGSMPH
jgi:signal transduction histidine kinase/DNA-binding response OmpR family regulator/ligand-binding sensor domain-containing protein